MTSSTPCVYVLDDDRSVLKALARLLSISGYAVQVFDSPREFLSQHDPEVPGCALFDIGMRELDGFALQEMLQQGGCSRPVIFITGHDDVRSGVRAMKAGAFDYLTKPVREGELLTAVGGAIEVDQKHRQQSARIEAMRRRLGSLTAREAEVMTQVVRGRLNKQIAFDLGIVEKTVKVHRARVMEKMNVRSVAALVHIADSLGVANVDESLTE